MLNALIDGTITEIYSEAESVREYAFYYCSHFVVANFQKAITIGHYAFENCAQLATIYFPIATSIGAQAFYNCAQLITVDFPAVKEIKAGAVRNCKKLTSFIIRTVTVCSLSNVNAFTSTPIKSGTGYIYVPSALIDSYKSATNWSTYAAQFRALEDYTVDGTITGALDPEKTGV